LKTRQIWETDFVEVLIHLGKFPNFEQSKDAWVNDGNLGYSELAYTSPFQQICSIAFQALNLEMTQSQAYFTKGPSRECLPEKKMASQFKIFLYGSVHRDIPHLKKQ